jgi:hypothetical protein
MKSKQEVQAHIEETKSEYLLINGYFKDDNAPFENYKVKVNIQADNEEEDNEIFYYFDGVEEMFDNEGNDFVITEINYDL